ncbi:MAG: ROK family protein [Anaerolineae bacterium]
MEEKRNLAVGVDLGATSLYAAVVDVDSGERLGEEKAKSRAELGADAVTGRVVRVIKRAISKAGIKKAQVVGVGVGVPGPVLTDQGLVLSLTNMGPTWKQYPLGARLAESLGLRVIIDNDVNVGAVGEHRFGAGRGTQDMIAMFVGTGVGGGVIINGRLHTGFRGSAGEVGHMIVQADGELCGCGERGHAEAYASRTGIEKAIQSALDGGETSIIPELMNSGKRTSLTSAVLERAYEAGDAVTVRAIREAQRYLGLLIASCVNLLDPEAVVIGGGMVERMGESYIMPAREVAYQHFLNKNDMDKVRILAAELGDASGAVGAAVLAHQRLI